LKTPSREIRARQDAISRGVRRWRICPVSVECRRTTVCDDLNFFYGVGHDEYRPKHYHWHFDLAPTLDTYLNSLAVA
jgi:hypothetical protein